MIFVAFNEINKHKAKYMMIVRMPKILFFHLKDIKDQNLINEELLY